MDTHHANDEVVAAFKAGYRHGRSAGVLEMRQHIRTLEMLADHWYFIANNPGSEEARRKALMMPYEIAAARADVDAELQRRNEEEQELIERAKEMLSEGHDDKDVAVSLGIYLPMVQTIRAGKL